MKARATGGQAAVELAIGLPILILLLITILQGAMLGVALHEAQLVANQVAAEAARSPGLLYVDPARFIDFGVYHAIGGRELMTGEAAFSGNRSFQMGAMRVRVEYADLLKVDERRTIGSKLTGGSDEEGAAQLMGRLDFGHVRVTAEREIEALPGIRAFHPQSFIVRASAVGGLAEEAR